MSLAFVLFFFFPSRERAASLQFPAKDRIWESLRSVDPNPRIHPEPSPSQRFRQAVVRAPSNPEDEVCMLESAAKCSQVGIYPYGQGAGYP